MIPTHILLGLMIGLLPKPWVWLGACIAALAWPLLLVTTGTIRPSDLGSMLGALALAAVNTAVGIGVTWVLIRLVRAFGVTQRP